MYLTGALTLYLRLGLEQQVVQAVWR